MGLASITNDPPGWLGWVLPIAAVVPLIAAFVRWFISTLRKLLVDIIETEVARLLEEKHQENIVRSDQDRQERAAIKQKLTNIEARLP